MCKVICLDGTSTSLRNVFIRAAFFGPDMHIIDMADLLTCFQEIVMLITHEEQQALYAFFETMRLRTRTDDASCDKAIKIKQILAYLEVMHTPLRTRSKKQELVFVDSGAGNCYLSFLVYYYYTKIDKRRIRIHCLDTNRRLMDKNRTLAHTLQFDHMYFHACDITDYTHVGNIDMVYALHACGDATDKALFLGLKTGAKHILSVSCCQHRLVRQLRRHPFAGMTRHRVFKEKLTYMVGDSLRAILLEMQGYEVDVLEFVSSRYTDKNIMIRAHKTQMNNPEGLQESYDQIRDTFHVIPLLEQYLRQEDMMTFVQKEAARKPKNKEVIMTDYPQAGEQQRLCYD